MKTKSLEKLASFQLKNEKLATVIGGEGGPAAPTLSIDVETTGAGETCFLGKCVTYSSDTRLANGGIYFELDQVVDKPC